MNVYIYIYIYIMRLNLAWEMNNLSLGKFSQPENRPVTGSYPTLLKTRRLNKNVLIKPYMAYKHLYAPTKVVFLNMLFSKITWLPQVTLAGKEKQLEDLREEIRM